MKIKDEYLLALKASIEASKAIMAIYVQDFDTRLKEDGSPVTKADLASSNIIKSILEKTGIPMIDEESKQESYTIRKNWKQVWLIDPLDGTKEFIKKNDEFVVNIALLEDCKPIMGLICSPVQERIILGIKNVGVFEMFFQEVDSPENWKRITYNMNLKSTLKLIGSRSHDCGLRIEFLDKIEATFGKLEMIKKGSAIKFFDLANGEASIYPRFAPTMEWDIAAGQAILEELGGRIVQAETFEELTYNKESLVNPHFIGLTQDVAEEFLKKFQSIDA
jgi:3'(2'), 5'-bisphosphate nucleotidase